VTAEEEEASPPPSGLRVLGQRDFFPYFAGNLLSNCGTWFQNIAQALLVYRLTKSTLLVGVVNFAQFVGVFVLSPWAGSAADRFDRRRLLLVTQMGAVAVTGGLALLTAAHHATAPVVIGMALVLGLTTAFAIPALQALVPLLVTTADLPAAIALNSLTFNLARAIGPVLGAVVVAELGIAPAFALNSLSYVALIVGLLIIRPRPQAPRPAMRTRVLDGLRLVRDDARLLLLLGTVAAVSLSQDPVSTLTPAFAVHVYHHPDTLTGWLVGAFGAGSVIAAVTIAGRMGDPYRRMRRSAFLQGAAMCVFALSSMLGVGVLALIAGGFGFLTANTTATTVMQLEVEDAQRGRVMALWSIAFLGFRPVGSLVDGGVASLGGVHAAGVVMAVPALVCAAALTRLHRRART
jgi:MFS family permease